LDKPMNVCVLVGSFAKWWRNKVKRICWSEIEVMLGKADVDQCAEMTDKVTR